MKTNTKSQYFKLKELSISGYKNIKKKLDINFAEKDGITVFIGNNGCGKSNIIEAVTSIFAGLFQEKLHKTDFSYQIKYEIQNQEIDINYKKGVYEILIDGKKIDKASFENRKEQYLPNKVIGCYSGESLRLYDNYYKPYNDNYLASIKKAENIPSLPLLYIDKRVFEIAVLTLFMYDFSVFSDIAHFCNNILRIKKITNVSFTFAKKGTIQSWKENEVLRVIKSICDNDIKNIGGKTTILFDEIKDRLNLYEGRERELFQYLYCAIMPPKDKIIESIDIEVELNSGDKISINDLSEGEKKYILMKIILETLADENSLLLFDEPDSHIHISRKAELGSIFDKYKNRENIITTHSPTMAISFPDHLVGLGVNNDNVEIIDKKKGKILDQLTNGIWNAHEQNVFLASNKPMTLLVEGKTDKVHIEEAFKHLKNDYSSLDFDVFSMNSSEHIREVLIGLSCSEIEWEKKFVGIFDNDQAGQRDITSGFEKDSTEANIKHVKYKDGMPSTSFYAFLLPKPSGYTGKGFTIENCYDASKYEEAFLKAAEDKKSHYCNLSIDTIAEDIKNKSKIILANNAKSFNSNDFDGFKPIFELLEKIRKM